MSDELAVAPGKQLCCGSHGRDEKLAGLGPVAMFVQAGSAVVLVELEVAPVRLQDRVQVFRDLRGYAVGLVRRRQPKLLSAWGKNDPFFITPGAEAYRKDVPDANVVLLDTGHFALEEEADTIAELTDSLLRDAFAN